MEGRVKRLEEKEQNEPETSADTKPEEPDEGINWGMSE